MFSIISRISEFRRMFIPFTALVAWLSLDVSHTTSTRRKTMTENSESKYAASPDIKVEKLFHNDLCLNVFPLVQLWSL